MVGLLPKAANKAAASTANGPEVSADTNAQFFVLRKALAGHPNPLTAPIFATTATTISSEKQHAFVKFQLNQMTLKVVYRGEGVYA